MSKQEIIDQFESFITQENFTPDRDKFNEWTTAFDNLKEETKKEQQAAFVTEEGTEPAPFEYMPTAEDIRFDELIGVYMDQRKVYDRAKSAELENNYKEKQALIEELNTLIKDEENISKAYSRFNAIKQKWNEIGPARPDKRRELQSDYSRLIEMFYYNIKIYRELQQHDLKKNQELKLEVIEKINKLKGEEAITQVDFLVHQYLDEWDEIGPTFKEEWDKIREQFKLSINEVFDRIREHRKNVKDGHDANLALKQAIVDKAQETSTIDFSEMKAVQMATKELISLQKEWKKVGYAGRKGNDKIWKDFRTVCDAFFDKRGDYLATANKKFVELKERKKTLIEKAKEIHSGGDSEKVANQLKALQREWKDLGKILPQDEYKLFKEFRKYCDAFFNRKKEEAKAFEKELKENLDAKEVMLIEFSKSFEKELKEKGDILIAEWKKEWAQVGEVPSKFNAKIESSLTQLVSKAFAELGISKADIIEKEFNNKVEILLNSDNAEPALDRERRSLRVNISEAESSVRQLEDKLDFFKFSNNSNPLKKELLDRIEDAKSKVDAWKKKRKQIDLMLKDIRRKEQELAGNNELEVKSQEG
tara:strand:+ start:151 stop:1923 length:1773 start_codon:yes stop_codon:yes gene_type:complete